MRIKILSVAQERARLIGTLLAIFLLSLLAAFTGQADASDKRVVSVFADGENVTFTTTQTTVSSVLDSYGVTLDKNDLVEPALDTEIISEVFSINVYRARPIQVVDEGKKYQVNSPYQSARLIAKSAGIRVFPEDEFTLRRINNIVGELSIGQRLTIDRAMPISIELYGDKVKARTQNNTVAEVLAEKGIQPDKEDIVIPRLRAEVKEGMKISVIHVGSDTVRAREAIPYDTKTINDSNKLVGFREVKTAGVNGKKLVTYEVELQNDKEVSRRALNTVVIRQSKQEVVIVGTKLPAVSGGSNIKLGQSMAANRGWTGNEWSCLSNLWQKESGWNHLAANPSSSAYGIPQSLPGSKMATAGADWATNPATQIKWGMGYIEGRYGTPCGAWDHSVANGWY